MFYREADHFTLDELRLHGPNVASFQLAPRGKMWYVVRCYISPDDDLTIEAVVAATSQKPCGADLLVIGNFNADLESPEKNVRDEESDAALNTTGLEDMGAHFFPRRKPWLRDGHTWSMLRGGREVGSQTDYILGTDRHLLHNVSVHDARHNTYRYLVMGCLR